MEGQPGPVAFHANTLHRARLNLVHNALDAMPRGGTLTLPGHDSPDGWTSRCATRARVSRLSSRPRASGPCTPPGGTV